MIEHDHRYTRYQAHSAENAFPHRVSEHRSVADNSYAGVRLSEVGHWKVNLGVLDGRIRVLV